MLATMVVTNLGDGSLANLAGDGQLSLREAVEAINTAAPVDGIDPLVGEFGVGDTILFQSSLFSSQQQTLLLTAGQIEMTKSVTLFGPGSSLLTIDAQQNSRIFAIAPDNSDYAIAEMTLTGGLTTALDQAGGAIRSMTTGLLSVLDTVVTENGVTGQFATGGGISALGKITLVGSTVSNNFTAGQTGGNGGGIFTFGDVILTRSTVSDNRTEGSFSSGGGISSGSIVTLNNSTVSGNLAMGSGSAAGGISANTGVVLFQSTVSGNQTSGNAANGGGVSSLGPVTISFSTIVENRVLGNGATGAGVWTATSDIRVLNSILANNIATGGNHDIQPGTGTLDVSFSLIGDATGLGLSSLNNLLDTAPLLGPLSGGGTTKTHAPLPGSPVIDGGPDIILSPPLNDQRGAPFDRIANGDDDSSIVIDIGSHEVQSPASADFDGDGDTDGADFLAWQRGYGKSAAVLADGNADDDTDVDNHDLAIWSHQFGTLSGPIGVMAPLAAVKQPTKTTVADIANFIDWALAGEMMVTELEENGLEVWSQPALEPVIQHVNSDRSHQAADLLVDSQAATNSDAIDAALVDQLCWDSN